MIRFACPACGKVYKAGDDLAGKNSVCKKCGAFVVVPEQPIRVVLYGKVLPPEGTVEAEPEPDEQSAPAEVQKRRRQHHRDEDDAEEADEGDEARRNAPKPGKVTAIGGMLIGGGVWAIFANLASVVVFPPWCFWPGMYFAFVWAILAIIKGAGLLGDRWTRYEPRTIVVMQIAQGANLDVVNVVMGVVGLVFLNEREIATRFRRR